MANAKSSYFEKLKDPRWQKKRLEVLEKSSWACDLCGDTENTLHVHHKQYIKGREPWEYTAEQLSTLCDSCHESNHSVDDRLVLSISVLPMDGPNCRDEIASLISGFSNQPLSDESAKPNRAYLCGELAKLFFSSEFIRKISNDDICKLIEIANSDIHSFLERIKTITQSHEDGNK